MSLANGQAYHWSQDRVPGDPLPQADGGEAESRCQGLRGAVGHAEQALRELAAQTSVMRAARPTTYEELDPLQPVPVPAEVF